jgi:hypothetical protein
VISIPLPFSFPLSMVKLLDLIHDAAGESIGRVVMDRDRRG